MMQYSEFTAAVFVILSISVASVYGFEPPATELLKQAEQASQKHESAKVIQLATKAISEDPKLTRAYYLRAREYFRQEKFRESVADFDRYVELRPQIEPQLWERGISQYYAELYKEGARQFELYQTYHDNDVENSVWRYLCMVPTDGIEKARSVMLPIENDRRIPMMQVFDLFRGKLKPQDVLEVANAKSPPADVLAGQLFYAHLYLGLYHHAAGEKALAKKYIELAADPKLAANQRVSRYMWDVARVHASYIKKARPDPKRSPPPK